MFTSCVLSYIRTSPVLCSSIVSGEHMSQFKLFSSSVCSHFHKWGASRAGEDSTLENSEHTELEAAEWKRLTHECVIDREESRLNLLIQLREFIGCFSS